MCKDPCRYVPFIFLCSAFLVFLFWVLLIIFYHLLDCQKQSGSLPTHIEKFYEAIDLKCRMDMV
ncbi:hypothetical protein V6Z11_A08G073700 [Gossypium hirsutum]